jgi:DNA-directed RNA polymerase delta subunit
MKLKELTKDEIEAMGYDEVALLVLQESGKKMKLQDLFKKVCKVYGYDYEKYADHITDLFELLSTNKKFVMLKNGYWDLQTRHQTEITIEDSEDDIIDVEEEDSVEEDEEAEEEDDVFYDEETDDDVEDDDLSDLVIIDEDEEAGS